MPIQTRNILNVFLASPSDVIAERDTAEEVINNLNKIIGRRLGWQIDLYKWEDIPPTSGRPQDIINPAVDKCSLFIGLLWERWEQSTGAYSSGFEEEYERARQRRKTEGAPDIWLVFKDVSQKRLRDAGPQLSKVLEFKQRQMEAGEVLFQRIRDASDWKYQLPFWLLQYLLNLTSPASGPESEPATLTPSIQMDNVTAAQISDPTEQNGRVPQQIKDLVGILNNVIKNGKLEFSLQEENLLQEFEIARLHLLSSTWMYGRYTGDLLESHEINKLYKYREQLEMTADERLQLFRALIADRSDIKPGWFWFPEISPYAVEGRLLNLIARDSSEEVKVNSLRILTAARITIPNDLWSILPLLDESFLLRGAAYEYLSSLSDPDLLVFLDDLIEHEKPDIAEEAYAAKTKILLRSNPTEAFDGILKRFPYIPNDLMTLMIMAASQISDESLLMGVKSDSGQLREFSVSELVRRGNLLPELAKRLTEDLSVKVRELAFQYLASRGEELDFKKVKESLAIEKPRGYLDLFSPTTEPTPDVDSIVSSFYRSQSTEKLLQSVEWFSVAGIHAYRVLSSERFSAVAGEIRSDLRDGFIRIKQQSVEAIKNDLGVDASERIIKQFDELDNFIHSQFTEAALRGLEINGQPADVSFGRHYLSNSDYSIKILSVNLIAKFGDRDDSPILLKIMREGLGELQEKAAAGALRLSQQPFEVARELIESNNGPLKKIGFEWLLAQNSIEVWQLFDKLLGDQAPATRIRSVYFFWNKLDRQMLEQKLVEYLDRTTYYYNVVTWLDRLLYSPISLREMFVQQLQKEAASY